MTLAVVSSEPAVQLLAQLSQLPDQNSAWASGECAHLGSNQGEPKTTPSDSRPQSLALQGKDGLPARVTTRFGRPETSLGVAKAWRSRGGFDTDCAGIFYGLLPGHVRLFARLQGKQDPLRSLFLLLLLIVLHDEGL
jgi:hypothetical protein